VGDRKTSILFAGGGTGGHLFPAIAIAEEIRRMRPLTAIHFAGTKDKIEARVVPQLGYVFEPIWISGLRRKLTLENLLFPIKLMASIVQSYNLMNRIRPSAVVGTGGYVSGPVVYAASLMRIPTILQEQNSYPGITTRMLSQRATEVHLTFESSARFLKRKDNIRVTGNPVRSSVGTISRADAVRSFGLDASKKAVLVFGGSLGATSLNTALLNGYERIVETGTQILWQTGAKDFASIREKANHPSVKVMQFIENMDHAYAACDLAVCRAGATTLAELTLAGVPSILVPYPFAAADHQTENAKVMTEHGASLLLADKDVNSRLVDEVMALLKDASRRNAMARSTKALGKPDAAAKIAQAILAIADAHHG